MHWSYLGLVFHHPGHPVFGLRTFAAHASKCSQRKGLIFSRIPTAHHQFDRFLQPVLPKHFTLHFANGLRRYSGILFAHRFACFFWVVNVRTEGTALGCFDQVEGVRVPTRLRCTQRHIGRGPGSRAVRTHRSFAQIALLAGGGRTHNQCAGLSPKNSCAASGFEGICPDRFLFCPPVKAALFTGRRVPENGIFDPLAWRLPKLLFGVNPVFFKDIF